MSGRDQLDQRFRLVRNQQTLVWYFDKAEIEIWEEPSEPVLEEIAKLAIHAGWEAILSLLNVLVLT